MFKFKVKVSKFSISASVLAMTLAFATDTYAARPFEGIWAKTQAECLDKEGPNTRTLIDLSNNNKGKSLPIFDQYEWHCKVLNVSGNDKKTTLKLRCFEFWDNLEKGIEATKTNVILVPKSKQNLRINGEKYIRCIN